MAVQRNEAKNCVYWKPNKRQEDFLRIPPTFFEAFYGGAAGGGKSEVLLMLPVVKNYIQYSNFKGIVFRRTFPELEESLIPKSHELGWEKYLGAKYNDTKHLWTFPSGALIRFSYMDTDADARSHDTAEYHYAGFDELTHFTEFQYTYIISRVRTSDRRIPAIMRSASNPGNIGHSWVRKRFVDPAPMGNVAIVDHDTKTKRIFIPAKATDNPYLMDEDPNYVNRLRGLPEDERKAKIDGDWYSFAGQVFLEFRNRKRVGEPDNAIHVIQDFKIPDFWPKVLAVDWGYEANLWAGWAAVSPDSKIFLFREYIAHRKKIKEWGADIARICQTMHSLKSQELDPSAWKKEGHEQTIAEQACAATNLIFNKADNDRLGGKLLIHDLLRWKPRPPKYIPKEGYRQETYDSIFRMYGLDAAREYQQMFVPEPEETNIPRLQIFQSCPSVIDAIQLCVYDERNKEDVAEFDGDDPYDGLRYLLKATERYLTDSTYEANRLRRTDIVYSELANTGDWNSFYRQMEFMDASERKKVLPFSRYGGRYQGRLKHALRR